MTGRWTSIVLKECTAIIKARIERLAQKARRLASRFEPRKTNVLAKALILCSLAWLLTGCTDTGPIKIGPDTYTISTRVPLGGPASAKGQALQEANAYCSSQGREILLQHEQSSECALHGGCGEAEIEFYCLKAGDPMLKRPEFKAEPNQRVEIDQK